MEYARYSASQSGYVRRENADHPWEHVPVDDVADAEAYFAAEAARIIAERRPPGATIFRQGQG